MSQLLRREFTIELPVEKAWRHLARVEQWPSWAKHIKQVQVQPPGQLGQVFAYFLLGIFTRALDVRLDHCFEAGKEPAEARTTQIYG